MNASSNGEVYGSNALYAAMVAGAVALLLASIWSPATTEMAKAGPVSPSQQMEATSTAPSHVS